MTWTTDGIRVKLGNAEEHLKTLDTLREGYVTGNPYSIQPEFDPETGWHTVYMFSQRPSDWLGVVIGDVAHNLRSALDHLAWQLASLDGPPPEPDKVQFPIFSEEPKSFLDHPCLSGMRPEHRAVLQKLQPYDAGDGESALEWLAWINNRDKHRLVHTTASHGKDLVPQTLKAHGGYSISRSEFGFSGLLDPEEGAEIGRLLIEPPSAELQVYMEFKPSFGIAFGDRDSPVYGQPADGLLRVLYDLVQRIALELFDRPGQSGSPPWP